MELDSSHCCLTFAAFLVSIRYINYLIYLVSMLYTLRSFCLFLRLICSTSFWIRFLTASLKATCQLLSWKLPCQTQLLTGPWYRFKFAYRSHRFVALVISFSLPLETSCILFYFFFNSRTVDVSTKTAAYCICTHTMRMLEFFVRFISGELCSYIYIKEHWI